MMDIKRVVIFVMFYGYCLAFFTFFRSSVRSFSALVVRFIFMYGKIKNNIRLMSMFIVVIFVVLRCLIIEYNVIMFDAYSKLVIDVGNVCVASTRKFVIVGFFCKNLSFVVCFIF